jgi:hypothetical protein
MQKVDFESNKSEVSTPLVDTGRFKELRINCNIEEDVNTCMFIPKYIRKPGIPEDDQYKLYYGPSNAFMFLMLFYSVYERILKA